MARFLAFFTLFHLSVTFFRPEVPFKERNKNALPIIVRQKIYGISGGYFVYRTVIFAPPPNRLEF